MEHEIPFGNSNRENGPTFLDFPLFLGIFQWDEQTKRVPFTAEPEIPEILTKWKTPREKEEEGTPVRFVFKRSLHLFEPAVPISESLEQAKNKGKKRKGFLRR